ncbi:putative zinc-binding oxidoreductase ToxD [Zopfia rhizophila CBS 207.26]|uniref:Putative zinc-binding oxidoreductase ToxD n=1 Tax=Zopfia rhizophila CBS 207.26 TaxID=1314779 RepID=A0A6A6E659_9PEZI|nr:putative zinc-binding oxidoreductase ToxD [Zopfia rhizophila CBS 207.26]
MVPSTIKAVVVESLGKVGGIATVPTPKLRDDYILVKTIAVGLNPTDWQHVYLGIGGDPSGTRSGCDYMGIVEEVGSKVTKQFKKGDRIAGFTHGSNRIQHEDGAFAEYIVAKGDAQLKIPDNLSDEEGAVLGVGISTVGQGLYQALQLALPDKPLATPEPILIYGGATATGVYAIQFAKASGYTVLTTASPRHEEYLRSLGADAIFDYNSPTWSSDVKAATNDQLKLAFDTIGSAETGKATAAAMSSSGGRYSSTEDGGPELIKAEFPNITAQPILAYTIIGEEFVWADGDELITFKARPEDFEFGKTFWELARGLLASGQAKPVRTTVDFGGKGLEGVLVGLEELRQGKVRGGKLVYYV